MKMDGESLDGGRLDVPLAELDGRSSRSASAGSRASWTRLR